MEKYPADMLLPPQLMRVRNFDVREAVTADSAVLVSVTAYRRFKISLAAFSELMLQEARL